MARKKIKFLKTKAQRTKGMTNAIKVIGGSIGGGVAYRLGRNYFTKDEPDTEKRSKQQQAITIGALAAGVAGVVFVEEPITAAAATGIMSVAGVDFISETFGDKIEEMTGATLGELPNYQTPKKEIERKTIVTNQAPALPEVDVDMDMFATVEDLLESVDTDDADKKDVADVADVEMSYDLFI